MIGDDEWYDDDGGNWDDGVGGDTARDALTFVAVVLALNLLAFAAMVATAVVTLRLMGVRL